MARIFRKRLNDELGDTPWTPRTILVLVVILVFVSGLLAVAFRYSRSGPYRAEYSGIVVEKWAKYTRHNKEGYQLAEVFRLRGG